MYHESWGSERLLFNVKSAIWQLYHRGENKLHSMRWWWCLICTRPTHLVGLYSANSLKQHSMGRHVISLRHFILILLLIPACVMVKQKLPILYSLVWPYRGSNSQSITLEAITLTITSPMQIKNRNCMIHKPLLFNYYHINVNSYSQTWPCSHLC
jgi:hypothetical protein